MCQAVRQQGATLNDLLPPTDMLHLLIMHPLRVQVSTILYFLVYLHSSENHINHRESYFLNILLCFSLKY